MNPDSTPTSPPERARDWIVDETSHGSETVSISQKLPRERLVSLDRAPQRDRDAGAVLRWLVAAVAVGGAAFLTVLSLAVVGATQIDRAERTEQVADAALFRQVAREADLLDRPFVSDRRDEAAALFASVASEADRDVRRRDAARLVEVLTVEIRTIESRELPSEDARRLGLEETVKHLRRLSDDASAQHERVAQTRASLLGWIAGLFGA